MNVSEVIVRYFEVARIGHVFGYPGDPNVELMEALRRRKVQFVLTRREGTAGLMAEAYGQLTGRPGVCMSTLGPGSSNLVNPVANAMLDRVPMLALSGQIDGKRRPYFTHQVLDHNRIFSPVAKWVTEAQPATVGTIMRKALRVAVAERPGPVHISTPGDAVKAEATDDAIALPPMREARGIQVFASDGVVTDPSKALAAAKRPVIVTGISAQRAGATDALVRLAERVGCPVVVAPMSKGVFPETHPYYASTLDMACNAYVWDFLDRADLILAVGFDAVELIKPWRPKATTIHIDTVPNTDQIYPAELEVVGPIPAIVDALATAHAGEPRWTAAEVREHRDGLAKLYYAGRESGSLNPTDVIDAVREVMPTDAIVSADVGSHKLLVGQGWRATVPRSVLMTNGLSSMGYSLPAAMTAKLLHRDREVVCFTGDGGLAMVQGELRLAASLGLGLCVVVFCDDSLNRIELKQAARNYPTDGTVFDATDMVQLAQSMGCAGVSVSASAELAKALAERPSDGPLVIGARINPAQYAAQF